MSFFENYEWHEYSLAPFALEAQIATKKEVENIIKKNNTYVERIKRKFLNVQPIVIHEQNLLYNEQYLNIKNNRYLVGYWQCEKYFEKIITLLRKELVVKINPSEANQQLLYNIVANSQSVSLHIRRGNFVNVDFVNKVHGTTKLDYYFNAIKLIEEKCSNPVFYIFSDDINWAKENIKLNHPMVFVDINTDKTDYEDLRLMSNCKHNILANSTFSWWGAWLNQNPEKVIIAPQEWFADEERNKESVSIIPQNWIRI